VPIGVPLDDECAPYTPHIEAVTSDDLAMAVVGSVAYAEPHRSQGQLAIIAGGPANPGEIWAARTDRPLPLPPAQQPSALTAPLTETGCVPRIRVLEWRRLTGLNAWLDEYALSKPERVIFPSIENGLIEGWLMKPLTYTPQAHDKHPAVLEIHGGPHATYGLAFMHEFQLLCARGFGVFYTNPRGSKGYGYNFAARVVGDWAGIDYHDLMAAADCLAKVRWVDPARMGVTGGSQGGYLTNFLIGHTTRFAAAVTQRSMSNLYSKYGVADNGWTHDRHGMGGADLWDSEGLLMERSPIRYAPYVRTPTLIIHSDQDLRCPLEQAEQWYVALKRLGVETEFVRFSGENHELSRSGKPRNRVERLERIVGWFERHMGPRGGE
jgi:dipeptidyl aminopeptidase/acylaminoacyl peptidase